MDREQASTATDYGCCPVCGGRFVVTKKGVMRWHLGGLYVGRWRQMCEGVGKPPKELT